MAGRRRYVVFGESYVLQKLEYRRLGRPGRGKGSKKTGPKALKHNATKSKKAKPEVSQADFGKCHFLRLPIELRWIIYDLLLHQGGRIFFDRQNLIPEMYQQNAAGLFQNTLVLLQTCKQVHGEVLEFTFGKNLIVVINPLAAGDFSSKIHDRACQFITKMQIHLRQGIGDLGLIWKTMHDCCPKLRELRLIFYHEPDRWAKTVAQLALHIGREDHVPRSDQLPHLELELYESVWAKGRLHGLAPGWVAELRDQFSAALVESKVIKFDLPSQLRKIVVTASVAYPGKVLRSNRLVPLPAVSSDLPAAFKIVNCVNGNPTLSTLP